MDEGSWNIIAGHLRVSQVKLAGTEQIGERRVKREKSEKGGRV